MHSSTVAMENYPIQATSNVAVTNRCTGIVRNVMSLVQSAEFEQATIQMGSLKKEIKKIVRFIENTIRSQEREEESLISRDEEIKREIGRLSLMENQLKREQTEYKHDLENKNRQLQEAKNELSKAESERKDADEDLERVKKENETDFIETTAFGILATVLAGPAGFIVGGAAIVGTIADAKSRLDRAKNAMEQRSSDVTASRERISELEGRIQTVITDLKSCSDQIAELNSKMRECHDQIDRVRNQIIFFKQGIEFWTILQTLSEENVCRIDLLSQVLQKSLERPKVLQHSSGFELMGTTFLEAWEEFITKSEIGYFEMNSPAIQDETEVKHDITSDFYIGEYTVMKSSSLQYRGNSIDFFWRGYGLQLYFGEEDFPTNNEYEIKILLLAPKKLTMPEDYEAVSGLYLIECSNKFNKPVTIRIQHCATESVLEHLVFATSVDKTNPHRLQCVKGKFDSNFGELQVTSFSPFIILRRLFSWFPRSRGTSYSAYLYHSGKYEQNLQPFWHLNFFIVKKLEIYESRVERHAQNMYLSGQCIVEFSDSASEISLERNITGQDFLQAHPITNQKLSKRVIDRYREGYPPGCGLRLESSNPTVQKIEITFNMIGLREPQNFIRFIWPTSIVPLVAQELANREDKTEVVRHDRNLSYSFTMKSLTILKWTDSNQQKHQISLINIISPHWKKASYLLGLTLDHTQRIERNNQKVEECCQEVMAQWFTNTEGMYNYPTNWKGLCELLGDLQLSSIAEKLHNVVL